MQEVRRRKAKAPPETEYWTIALQLGRELKADGKLAIKPDSFARRISGKLKSAEGILPKSPYRADYALKRLRTSLIEAWFWFGEYERATGRKRSTPDELSPLMREAMELASLLLSRSESDG